MSAPAPSDTVAESLLRYYRNPGSTAKPALNPQDFVAYFGIVARLALGKPVAFTNPGLATPPVLKTLRCAALHYIRRTQFRDGADHYQLLGVAPDASMQAIRENHRLVIQIVHPDRASPEAGWPDGIAARVNRAYFILKHPESRAAYDLQRSAGATRPPPVWGKDGANAPVILRRGRPPPVRPVLPEWLTAGIGDFVRRNPATAIFAVLVSACSLAVASVIWLESGMTLKRGDAPRPPPAQLPSPSFVPSPADGQPSALPAPLPTPAAHVEHAPQPRASAARP